MVDSKIHALDFFEQLSEFSKRFVQSELKIPIAISPWGSLEYRSGEPKGAILHYTADDDLHRVLRWFLTPEMGARCSAHVVIADRRLTSQDDLGHDLPLVQELPATIIQVRQYHTMAWHATWTNTTCYGIENVNVGPLRMISAPTRRHPDGIFTSWRPRDRSSPEWTARWSVPYKEPIWLHNSWWAPYTTAQIEANVILLRYLQQLYGSLQKPWILGHEHIQKDKRDPGPAFPVHGIRQALFDDWTPVTRYDWFRLFDVDPLFGQTVMDGVLIDYARKLDSERPNPLVLPSWERFRLAIRALPDKDGFGLEGKTALRMLGYHVTSLEDQLDLDELVSVGIFQRMMGLKVDSQPGPVTKRALVKRLESCGLLSY